MLYSSIATVFACNLLHLTNKSYTLCSLTCTLCKKLHGNAGCKWLTHNEIQSDGPILRAWTGCHDDDSIQRL